MSIGTGVILPVALQEIDAAPHAQAAAQGDHEGLQNVDCAVEKFHRFTSIISKCCCWIAASFSGGAGFFFVRQVDFVKVKDFLIDRSLISHIEAGKRGCTVDMLVQLSELFNVSLDLLILGRETVTSLDDEVKAHLRSVISGLISYLEMLMKKI